MLCSKAAKRIAEWDKRTFLGRRQVVDCHKCAISPVLSVHSRGLVRACVIGSEANCGFVFLDRWNFQCLMSVCQLDVNKCWHKSIIRQKGKDLKYMVSSCCSRYISIKVFEIQESLNLLIALLQELDEIPYTYGSSCCSPCSQDDLRMNIACLSSAYGIMGPITFQSHHAMYFIA